MTALAKVGGAEALAALGEALESADPKVRAAAATAAACAAGAEGDALVTKALEDKEPTVRAAAAYGLRMATVGLRTGLIEKALSDAEPSVRRAAAMCLFRATGPDALKLLEKAVSDTDGQVRTQAVWGLSRLQGDKRAFELLKRLLEDQDAGARRSAASAVASSTKPEARDLLIERFGIEPDKNVRAAIERSLRSRFRNDPKVKAALEKPVLPKGAVPFGDEEEELF